MHKEHKVYVPEMIFGQLLTGANFDDNEKKVVGGRNGYGAKLANVYSTHFIVECNDAVFLLLFLMFIKYIILFPLKTVYDLIYISKFEK